jgi:hypothetical protein
MFCSGAGFATRALLTARDESGDSLMLVVTLNSGERVCPLDAPLQGMRGSVTGAVDFSGCSIAADSVLGTPGDYLYGSRISQPAPGVARPSRRADCVAWSRNVSIARSHSGAR